jgi:LuxR family transcriptional regulator, maltose regulon positive regulatory protein
MVQQQTQQIDISDLVHTKLVPPQLRSQLVSRTALLGRLDAALNCKLTLVSAPAGFGKSTLVADWLRRHTAHVEWASGRTGAGNGDAPEAARKPLKTAWVALDAGDNDPIRFWRYILAACQAFSPEIGGSTRNVLRVSQRPDYEAALTMLLNDLAELPCKSVLVLEDYHLITTKQIHEQLTFVIERLPTTLHLVLLTRSDPPLPLARLRAQSHVHELRAEDMQFSLVETQLFLRQVLPYLLPDDAIVHLRERTEGWAAGLHLIALSLERHHDIQRATQALALVSGRYRHITAYFGAEVLQTQPEPIQIFLLQTSTLSRLTASICDALTGRNDSAAILEYLERANLFIVPLDETGQWYRYHALFAESVQHLARRRLGEDAVAECCNRASVWYEQQGLLAEAIEAALIAKAFARAATLIERMIGPAHFQEQLEYHTIRRWLGTLPQTVLAQHPRLCLRFALLTLFSADGRSPTSRAQMERSLSMAEHAWLAEGNHTAVGAVRAACAIMEGELGEPMLAARLAYEALGWLGDHDHNWRAGCLRLIGSAKLLEGLASEARQMLQDARTHFETAGNSYGLRATLLKLGDACVLGGELRQAAELYRAVHRSEGVELIDKGTALLGLAGLSYEWNALESAEYEAQAAYQLGVRLADEPLQVRAMLALVRVQHARGQTAPAQQQLYALIARIQHPLLLRATEAAQAQLALATGDLAAVERWHAAALWSGEELPLVQQECEALIVARMHIAQGNRGRALEILDHWQANAQATGRIRSELEMLLLIALSHIVQADIQPARQALLRALAHAQPEGYLRLFLDEWELLADPLRAIVANTGEYALGKYAHSLLHAATEACAGARARSPTTSSSSINHLSQQELRVLQLLAAGQANQQIADALVVSVNTIKTQLKSIYRKLNVANRVEASMVAQRLELL